MSTTQEETLQSLRTIKVAETDADRSRVLVVAGDRPGRRATVIDQLVIGRSRTTDLQVDDAQVSRRHARIFRKGAGWVVEDLGSRNGTALNGKPLSGASPINIGDRVQIGDSLLVFSHHDPLEDRLAARQKLEAIGSLGTGIAHDFNNLLGAVTANLDYLARLETTLTLGDERVDAVLRDVRAAVTRANKLTDQLLGFARTTSRPHGPVNLSKTVEEVLALVRHTFDRRIEVRSQVEPKLGIKGDRDRIHQVVMNLCLNARDSMPDGGRCDVILRRASALEVDSLPIRTHDDYAVLMVIDAGAGMSRETQKRIFEPFFTTKPEGRGAGLGLAITYEAVDQHGGQIEVASELGRGTTMRVMFPLASMAPDSVVQRRVTPAPEPGAQPARRILIVDDEDVMRRSTRRLLQQLGHHTVEASDGEEALALYFDGPRPDVVLLDLNMPRMNGEETLRRLTALDPKARVVVVSGYVEREVEERLQQIGVSGIVDKPFNVETLEEALFVALRPERKEHPTAPEFEAARREEHTAVVDSELISRAKDANPGPDGTN